MPLRLSNLALVSMSFAAGAIAAGGLSLVSHGVPAAQAATLSGFPPPDVWTMDSLNAMELDALPDMEGSYLESGTGKNSETIIFEGENVVSVWNAGPARLAIDEPFPYDEFVVVLKGELVLTDDAGHSVTYSEGDMFMVPKGFVGTWDMTEEYRELIVIDTVAYYEEG
ncbi:MAG: cupin domain-containing protein [Pseudomonadota bacterium]